jgi:hypothetical protein
MDDVYRSGRHTEKNPDWAIWDSAYKATRIVRLLKKHEIAPRSLCDVGCGSGLVLAEVAASFPKADPVVGYEIRPEAEVIWQSRSNPRIDLHIGDFFGSEGTFDVVMAIDVIEHVENPWAFLRLLRSRSSLFVFHIPLDLSASTVIRHRLEATRAQVGHLHYYTRELALALLAECGYEVVDSSYTLAGVDLAAKAWRTTAAKIPRKLLFGLNAPFAARSVGGASLLVLARSSDKPTKTWN